MKKLSLIKLFLIFVKIGAILLGGGYVILPILRNEFVEKRNFINDDDLIDYFRTADVDFKSNKCVIVGLGEYLALRGEEEANKILRKLKSTTLGSARVVILLRSVTAQFDNVISDDIPPLTFPIILNNDDETATNAKNTPIPACTLGGRSLNLPKSSAIISVTVVIIGAIVSASSAVDSCRSAVA